MYKVDVEANPGDAVSVDVEVDVAKAPTVLVTDRGAGDGPNVA